jgi:hypothetical protein
MRFTGHMVVPIKIEKTIPARQGIAAPRLPQGRLTRAVDQGIMAIGLFAGVNDRWGGG